MSTPMKSEEDVKIHYLPGILSAAGHALDRVQYDVAIEVKQGRKKRTIFADAVVYADKARTVPLVVVETKPPIPLQEGDADQAFSYARLLTPIAPVVLLTNGTEHGTRAYDTFTKKLFTTGLPSVADAKKIAKTPHAAALVAEAKQELFKVDNVQEYKRILRASHNAIRNNEGYDPTQAFDELSKVMFTKLYEERSGKERFTVKKFDEFLDSNVNIVQQMFGETTKNSQFAGLFAPGASIELSDRTLRDLVGQFEGYDLSLTDFDVKGEAFEHFLGDTFTGGLGQYFTPRNVVNFMVDALAPKPGEKVVDPFCGTGGFLIKWHESVEGAIDSMPVSSDIKSAWTKTLNTDSLYGIDWNERTSLACRMNMTVHGEGQSAKNIFKQSGFEDALGDDGEVVIGKEYFDVVLTNPPFGSAESDPTILSDHKIGSGKKSIERAALAMERALALTKPGGWVGIIVMDGILSNSSMRFVRDHVREHAYIRALISLTPETFEAYGGRSNTTILFLEKKLTPSSEPQVDSTFMAMCRNSGYAPNGTEIAGNELPDILAAYQEWRDKGTAPAASNTWVSEIRERLDPSHYWRPTQGAGAVGALKTELEKTALNLTHTAQELQRVVSALENLQADTPLRPLKLGELMTEVIDVVKVQDSTSYRLLGVRWWGGGSFIREEKLGSQIKGSTLRKVKLGALVYNRLFAYRGSFAVVGADCEDAHASAEFPMYEAKATEYDPTVLKKFIVHALNSATYLPIVDAESSGSTKTSRNRFKQAEFEAFVLALPQDAEALAAIVELLDKADALRDQLAAFGSEARGTRDLFAGIIPSLS